MHQSFRSEHDPATLRRYLLDIIALANSEKEALGFMPDAAYGDAISRRRLIAMLVSNGDQNSVAGYVMYSGVYPNARIQQIMVGAQYRRMRVATALINSVVARLEMSGYLSISAAVASDLHHAQDFYEQNGFTARRTKKGGQARGRNIVLRARDLNTASLFSILDSSTIQQGATDLGLRARSVGLAPLYTIDLNVLFDVTKNATRTRADTAGRLITAGLAHQVRLAVASEFLVELERQTKGRELDPVLKLAKQLPRLPSMNEAEVSRLAGIIHNIVFARAGVREAGSPQALSDSRHLAEAAIARASGYVTSDGRILAARDVLLQQIGIEVADLDEFVSLLPTELTSTDHTQLKDTNCAIKSLSAASARDYLQNMGISPALIDEFAPAYVDVRNWKGISILEGDEAVAIGICRAPPSIDTPARVLVHVRADHIWCDVFADYLLDVQCQDVCRTGPSTIELVHIPGQSVLRRIASLRGFLQVSSADTLIKVAIGRPITEETWAPIARQTRRKTGLQLPENPNMMAAIRTGLEVRGPRGENSIVRLPALEEALGPTIIVWPGRTGVVVPIARTYAADLLGTDAQFRLFGNPEAAFLTRKTYFNSPRMASLMQPGTPLIFYESKRSGGRGAAVAVARVVDATVLGKNEVPSDLLRRAVVDDLEPLSASAEVLATSFDGLLRFPSAISLEKLRELGAASSNFQTVTALTSDQLDAILQLGWANA